MKSQEDSWDTAGKRLGECGRAEEVLEVLAEASFWKERPPRAIPGFVTPSLSCGATRPSTLEMVLNSWSSVRSRTGV